MCKYCDVNKKSIGGYYVNEIYGEAETYICDNRYECCSIAYKDGVYCIRICGNDEGFSEPISWCPFCGRKLYVED